MQIRTARLDAKSSELEGIISEFWKTPAPYDPVWQQVSWSNMLCEVGQMDCGYFVWAFEGAKLLGYALLERRSIGFWKFGLFCIGGPNVSDESCLLKLEEAIIETARQCDVMFVQIEPVETLPFHLFALGYYKGFLERYTLMVNLSPSEEEILAQMKQKGRYNIKLAEKHGIEIVRSSGEKGDVDALMKLLEETFARDGFAGNSRKYYETLLASRKRKDEGLYLARKDGEIIAAAILVIEWKTAVYYYGASTSDNEKRKFMPAYLLQWEMMKAGKRAGCVRYDFLGVAPEGVENHRLAGVSDFKRKFGGEDYVFPDKRLFVIKKAQYWMFQTLRIIRRNINA